MAYAYVTNQDVGAAAHQVANGLASIHLPTRADAVLAGVRLFHFAWDRSADAVRIGHSLLEDAVSSAADGEGSTVRPSDGFVWPKPAPTGCEDCAIKIQAEIGGEIVQIDSPGTRLGESTSDPYGAWSSHQFVEKGGRGYDAFTGEAGLPIGEYLDQWKYIEHLRIGPP